MNIFNHTAKNWKVSPLVPSVQVAGLGSTLETIVSQVKHTDPQRSGAPRSISSSYLLSSFCTLCLSKSLFHLLCPSGMSNLPSIETFPRLVFCSCWKFSPKHSVLKCEPVIQLLFLNWQGHLGKCTPFFLVIQYFLCVLQQIICVVFSGAVFLTVLTMCFIPSGLKQNLVAILSNKN